MRLCLILSRETNTPISYWLDLPLRELRDWIDAYIDLINELKNRR